MDTMAGWLAGWLFGPQEKSVAVVRFSSKRYTVHGIKLAPNHSYAPNVAPANVLPEVIELFEYKTKLWASYWSCREKSLEFIKQNV